VNDGLAAVPTPDDEIRLSPERVWDEDTRPQGPAAEPGRRYTTREQVAGMRLIEVHDFLRTELTQLRALMARVVAGTADVGAIRTELHTMTIKRGAWALGGYCQVFCRMVTMHHTREDTDVFPQLRQFEPRLSAVLDRLVDEHQIIHAVAERLDRLLVAAPVDIPAVRAAVDLLTDTLLSHLSYEEQELTEPLARLWGLQTFQGDS
jgi:hypothetical protein